MTSKVDPEILRLYTIRRRIGKGVHCAVWKAVDRWTGDVVAIKKIYNAFRNLTDAQRTFREVIFLKEVDHPNIIKMKDVIPAENDRDIYLIFEFMDTDLQKVIQKGNILEDVHQRYIMHQLLLATKYLHSVNIIHRDLKPSNILLNTECVVKLCDFRLACSLTPPPLGGLNSGVTTCWYCPPEILLSTPCYGKAADLWALGCVLAEMLSGHPLFPGSSTLDQLQRIIRFVPPASLQELATLRPDCTALAERLVCKHQPLYKEIPDAAADALHLLHQLLVFNPVRRTSAADALLHPYVSRFRGADVGSTSSLPLEFVTKLNNSSCLTPTEYRTQLYHVIGHWKPTARTHLSPLSFKKPFDWRGSSTTDDHAASTSDISGASGPSADHGFCEPAVDNHDGRCAAINKSSHSSSVRTGLRPRRASDGSITTPLVYRFIMPVFV
uniref:extracellular signal-regulated kinase 2-like isoform X2 n=1 Tax=Myxine glutinosa TaxID=7769 RepID=UPI00358DFC45